MTGRIGQLLRQWRKEQGLTLEQAARAGGIGRVTLNRWETGVHQPRHAELESLLTAFRVNARQRQQAVALVETPHAQAQTRARIVQIGEQTGIGPLPGGGDLLRAMRYRRRLSTEETASRIGVTARTLQRWEQGSVWPSLEPLYALCYALEAQEEEIVALAGGAALRVPSLRETGASLDALWERFEEFQLYCFDHTTDRLNDLNYLAFAAQAWPLATRSESGQRLLAKIYANYAAYYLNALRRYSEAGWYADRALALMPDKARPEDFHVRAAIASASAAVYRGASPAPQRGLETLRLWLPFAPEPAYETWMLVTMADFLLLKGAREEAVTTGILACRAAERSQIADPSRTRKFFLARIQLRAGNAEEALNLAAVSPGDSSLRRTEIALIRAEAWLKLGDRSEAQDWLQRACADINACDLIHLRLPANALAAQLG